jgi:O-antigen ligase
MPSRSRGAGTNKERTGRRAKALPGLWPRAGQICKSDPSLVGAEVTALPQAVARGLKERTGRSVAVVRGLIEKSPRSPTRTITRVASPEIPSSATHRWTTGILVLILLTTPLAILSARVEMYDTTLKIAALFVGAALLLWRPARWWAGIVFLRRTPVGRAFCFLIVFSAAWLIVSSAFSGDPWLSFGGTLWRRLGALNQLVALLIAAVVAGHVYRDRSAAKTLMLAMEAAGAVASIYAILQYAGWDPWIPRSLYTLGTPPAVRPPATLSQATAFAMFLLAPISIAAWFRLHERASRWKRAHELILILTIASLILSGARSALLGLAAGAGFLIYTERLRIANRAALARAGVAALVFGAAIGLLLLLPAGKGLRGRIVQWAGDRAGGPRLLVWRDSMQLVWNSPIAGIGPEQFEPEFRKVESLELARAYPDSYHESPHNFLLETATGQGLVGLALWIALLGMACRCGFLCFRRRDSEANPLSAGLIAILIALQFTPLTLPNELYLVALSAMLVALNARAATAESGEAMLSPALTVAAIAAGVVLVCVASAYIAQAVLYTQTERRVLHGDLPGAGDAYEAARKFPMPGPNLAVSKQLASVAPRLPALDRGPAYAAAKEAAAVAELGSAERFNALYQSAVLAIITRDLPRAESKLRAAIDAAPVWYRPRMALASVLWWEGRGQEAEQEAALALNCAGRVQPFVRQTLNGARAQAGALQGLVAP